MRDEEHRTLELQKLTAELKICRLPDHPRHPQDVGTHLISATSSPK